MSVGRGYTAVLENRTVAAADPPIDLISLQAADQKAFDLDTIKITQHTEKADAQAEMIRVRITRRTGTVTVGSGGIAITPRPDDPGSPAAGVTARGDDTTQQSGGTAVTLGVESFHVAGGQITIPIPETVKHFSGGAGSTAESVCQIEIFGANASDDLDDDIDFDVEVHFTEFGG